MGNGAPLVGGSNSQVGIGVLTPSSNKTEYSLRLLGTDKAAGVYVRNKALIGDKPIFLGLETPIDGQLNQQLPK